MKRSLLLEAAAVTVLVTAADLIWSPPLGVIFGLSFLAGLVLAVRHGAASRAEEGRLGLTIFLGAGLGLLITVVSGTLGLLLTSDRGRLLQLLGSLFLEPYEHSWQLGIIRLLETLGFFALLGLAWLWFSRRRRHP